MTKFCEHCGADISHHKHGNTRFCQRSDGAEGCYIARRTAQAVAANKKRSLSMRIPCANPKCQNYLEDANKECCSRACARELRKMRAEADRLRMISGHLVWPYKLPMDISVTPSMMCPLG